VKDQIHLREVAVSELAQSKAEFDRQIAVWQAGYQQVLARYHAERAAAAAMPRLPLVPQRFPLPQRPTQVVPRVGWSVAPQRKG
jgi:hypothetical protein